MPFRMDHPLTVLLCERLARMFVRLSSRKQRFLGTLIATSLLFGVTIWYLFPAITFGGRYHHRAGGSVYEFRAGRFYENDKDLGHYTVHLRTVAIHLENVNESFDATIGWYTVSMPIFKYGPSLLIRESADFLSSNEGLNSLSMDRAN